MGSGSWSVAGYATTSAKIASGTTFGYDSAARARGIYKAHDSLDPKKAIPNDGPYAGQVMRESRDNDEHPNSTPIIIGFDNTGSMGRAPRTVQTKVPSVFGLLVRKGYVEDPQIAIATYGDAYCDRVPLQFSQFESDNRIDENLDNLFLEGGGGGNNGETATMLLYFAAYHTATDAYEKRGKKGYLFIIADEKMLPLTDTQVKETIGDLQPAGDLSVEALAEAVQEKWEVVILLIDNYAAKAQRSFEHYSALFGEDHVLTVQDIDTIAETIASVVGVLEGVVSDSDELADDLRDVGTKDVAIRDVTVAVSRLGGKKEMILTHDVGAAGAGAARL